MKCRKRMLCSLCPSFRTCPASVRRNKRARRTKADSAGPELVRRAAAILETGWFSCHDLALQLFGQPKPGRSGLMSILVRARRPINRLKALGVLAVRPNAVGSAAYTLTDWPEGVSR